jgi:hypothetical protein
MILIKISSHGWEKEFQTENELKEELYRHLCGHCKDGHKEEFEGELFYEQDPIDSDSSLDEMLSTSCGCEFYVEDDDDTV